jgi:nucleotide-binding universal stress UspA family protein
MFSKVLVALDGSVPGYRACRAALEVAARFGARLTLLTVVAPELGPQRAQLESLVPRAGTGLTLNHQIEEAKANALAMGIPAVETVVLRGRAIESVLGYLRTHPHDLLVVGSRGLSRGSRLVLGSFSSEMVNRAPCPVLVVRPAPASSPVATGTESF